MKSVFPVCALVAILFLSSCAENPYDRYVSSLARVLDEQVPDTIRNVDPPPFPRPRELTVPTTTFDIDLFDFLAIGDCELQSLVGHRNSSLGKVAPASQRLVYELQLLAAISRCITLIEQDEPQLTLQLIEIQKQKVIDLPKHIYSATLAGEEFRLFWRQGQLDAESVSALARMRHRISRWREGVYKVDARQFEIDLQHIGQGGLGETLRSWAVLQQELPRATTLLERRLERRKLCFADMHNPEAEHFRTVVMTQFIGGLQRSSADSNKKLWEALEIIEASELLLADVMPQSYVQWQEARNRFVMDGRDVLQAHVAALEPLMQQCGFLPG